MVTQRGGPVDQRLIREVQQPSLQPTRRILAHRVDRIRGGHASNRTKHPEAPFGAGEQAVSLQTGEWGHQLRRLSSRHGDRCGQSERIGEDETA